MADAPSSRRETAGPLVWRSWMLRLALTAVPLWLLVLLVTSNVAVPIRLIVAIVLGVTLASPVYGLLLVALGTPLGDLLGQVIGAGTIRVAEVIVVAFLIGWLLRALPDRRGPHAAAPVIGWLFAAAIVASVVGLTLQLGRFPGQLAPVLRQLERSYFLIQDRLGVGDAARLLEGIGLVTATVMLFRRQPALARTLPLALGVSAAAAGVSTVLLWRGIGTAASLARQRLIGYRVSGHIGDLNAAGTYFAMLLCLGLGMAAHERGRARAIWCVLASASGAGLWLTGSRSALGAAGVVIIAAVIWVATGRLAARTRALVLTAVVIVLVGAAMFRGRSLERDPEYHGMGFREQFVQTSLRMIASRPLFGVGVGQYYRTSPLFLSPELAWTYGFENGHNYFLQICAELGIAGFGLFAAWLGAGVARALRALARAPADVRLLGVAGGVIAFLITCVTGHPFLTAEVAHPFWLQMGLMTALAGSTWLNRSAVAPDTPRATARARSALAAAAAIVILVWSPIATARVTEQAPASPAVHGFFEWERLEDGTRFRWTGRYASIFVPIGISRVEIPVRLPVDGRSIRPMGVEVTTGGAYRGRTMVDGNWAIISLRPIGTIPPMPFQRIDLKVDRAWEPAVYIAGSADRRMVGVQVGEPRLFRD